MQSTTITNFATTISWFLSQVLGHDSLDNPLALKVIEDVIEYLSQSMGRSADLNASRVNLRSVKGKKPATQRHAAKKKHRRKSKEKEEDTPSAKTDPRSVKLLEALKASRLLIANSEC